MDGPQPQPNRVLSIQSHVVRGNVGNRAAAFALQLLGTTVDIINSVQFASMFVHHGQVLDGKDMARVLHGLETAQANITGGGHPGAEVEYSEGVCDYSDFLTGYTANAEFLRETVDFIGRQKICAKAAGFIPRWISDPVMGDNGKLYVPREVVDVYRNEVVPLADIMLPNHYELQWLCGCETIKDFLAEEEVTDLCRILHRKGLKTLVITSVRRDPTEEDLILFGSEMKLQPCGNYLQSIFTIEFPRKRGYWGGTGDLMAAMLLAGLRKDLEFVNACEEALDVVQAVITESIRLNPKAVDIDVVGGRFCILETERKFKAKTPRLILRPLFERATGGTPAVPA